jgi:hypothetical protein
VPQWDKTFLEIYNAELQRSPTINTFTSAAGDTPGGKEEFA